jgi:hypothetical protein
MPFIPFSSTYNTLKSYIKYHSTRTSRRCQCGIRPRIATQLTVFTFILTILFVIYFFGRSESSSILVSSTNAVPDVIATQQIKSSVLSNNFLAISTSKTVVFFAYSEAQKINLRNFEYYLEAGIWNQPTVDYVIVINGDKCTPCEQKHPKLSFPNVRVLKRDNTGYDFAGYAFGLKATMIQDYSYFIFFNAGVRGPMVPKYEYKNLANWTRLFTDMFTDVVKLVGPTISCELQLHVQSHFFAVDKIGLDVIFKAGVFMSNAKSINELVIHSELGLTTAIMNAGYSIDSMMGYYNHFYMTDI